MGLEKGRGDAPEDMVPTAGNWAVWFERLEASDAKERAELVLSLLELDPAGPLDLSARDGVRAALDEIDLGRVCLEARIADLETRRATELESPAGAGEAASGSGQWPPAWWDGALRGVVLRGAKLSGARLSGAVLRGADLRGADLRDASLAGADLVGARLEEVDLRGADLAGADLRGAALGNADLRGAMLEDALLRKAGLRFAKLAGAALDGADLRRADLWGADLDASTLAKADLRGALLREATLRGADLSGALLRRSDISRTDFSGADLSGADLRGAQASASKFSDAILRDARLDGLDLFSCDLSGVYLRGASLAETRLRADQLGGSIGEERAGAFGEARKGYLALERYFLDTGDPDASSWSYRRRRRMQKYESLRDARHARAEGRRRAAAAGYFNYASDQLVEWVCDYGESIPRVLLSMLTVYLGFVLLYGLMGGVVRNVRSPTGAEVAAITRNPLDLAVFSLMVIVAGDAPAGLEPRNDLVILLTGFQTLLGVALTGLLGFVLGNLVRR